MIEKKCNVSGKKFLIEKEDLEFYTKMGVITQEDLSDLLSGKISDCAGLPTLCPEERQRRRHIYRNEKGLYYRTCDKTGKTIFSHYGPRMPRIVYNNDYWWSDKWSPLNYGRDFDFSRSFFEQFNELLEKVPHYALDVTYSNMINSNYCNCAGALKNCYLVFDSEGSENCMYSYNCFGDTDCLDCENVTNSELGYELSNVENGYECFFSKNLKNCQNCWFSSACIGCKNCFGCVNLRNKEYYFLNKKYSKDEYEKKIATLHLSSYASLENLKNNFESFVKKFPHKFMNGSFNENVSGELLYQNKNVHKSYECYGSENLKYCDCIKYVNAKNFNCQDVSYFGIGITNCYESKAVGYGVNQVLFSFDVYSSGSDIYYSQLCLNNCEHVFGCVSLKHKKYCILNKQYSKEEYFELKEKIIAHMKKTGEWGEFFPASMSPFAYNETVANEYFPLTKTEAEKRGYKWKDEDEKKYVPQTYKIPDDINDVPDSIVNEVLACEQTGKNFKIQKAELKFYRKMNLPIPRLHPDVRHANRMALRNPRKLWIRKCGDCNCELQTTFDPARPEKVLCENCYLKVVD